VHLFLLGVSHRTAPVDLRERLDFSSRDLSTAAEQIAARPSMRESVVLSTCNRSEIYAATMVQRINARRPSIIALASTWTKIVEGMKFAPAISEVLTDWLLTYPEPNDERLAELRDLARQVESDPAPLLGTTAPSKISEALPLENSRAAAEDAPRTVVVRHGGSR